MSNLLELAERCEKATEADREVDMEILRVITGKHWLWLVGKEVVTWAKYGCGAPGNPVCSLEEFTASIDAALTLVPDGFHVAALGFCPDDEYRGGWHCELVRMPDYYCFVGLDDGMNFHREDPKRIIAPALALCAAALRARQSISHVGGLKSD